jgi:hypothetical protein
MRARKSVNVARSVLLDQYAHRNRQRLTPSEARLWSALSGRKLGVQFRRHRPSRNIRCCGDSNQRNCSAPQQPPRNS